jgi:hypothetical protein
MKIAKMKATVAANVSLSLAETDLAALSQHWHREMYLMHRYGASTSVNLTTEPMTQYILQHVVPMQALDHPFLTHACVAIAATHMASEHPNENMEWMSIAFKHQIVVSAHVRRLLPSVDQSNCHAVLLAMLLMCAYSIAFNSFSPFLESSSSTSIADLIMPVTHVRGLLDLMRDQRPSVLVAPFETLFETRHDIEPRKKPSFLIVEPFVALHELIDQLGDAVTRDPLEAALSCLQRLYVRLGCDEEQHEEALRVVWAWVALIPHSFVQLLREGHGGALAIYAHFAVLAKACAPSWIFDPWSEKIVRSVANVIAPEWREAVVWAEEQVAAGYPILKTIR